MKNIFLPAFFSLFTFVAGMSQGTLSGTITDINSGETLIGANVVIDGTTTGTSTDFDGKYQFDAPAGTYTIHISYIGFQEKRVEGVVIKDNEVTYLDVSLSDQAIDLGVEITVTAAAIERSENAILMLQKKSDKIQDGISSQEMSKFAVSDAAGAMKKVTGATVQGGKYINIRGLGDRYSLTQLNDLVIPSTDPYRNAAQLDLIPTNLLENIITSKTFTPDQPGNFTGGNVNIKTKSFPEQFSFTVSASAGYNPQNNLINNFLTHAGGSTDYWGYDDGSRSMPTTINEQTRELLSDNSELIARLGRDGADEAAQALDASIRSLNRQFEPSTMETPVDHSLSLAFGNQYNFLGRPLGVIMSASFKQSYRMLDRFQKSNWVLEDINSGVLGNQGDFEDTQSTQNPTLNGLFGLAYKFSNLSSINFNLIYNHNTEKFSRSVFGERPDNIIAPDFLEGRALSFNEREILNYQLSGTHVFEGLNNMKLEWKGSYTESSQDEPMTRFFENQYNLTNDFYSLPLSNIQRPFYFFRYLADEQLTGKIDLELPLGQGNTKIKIGSLITMKDRTFTEDRFQVSDKGRGETSISDLNGDVNAWMADDNVGILGQEGARYTLGNYIIDGTIPDNSYTGHDNVTAFYGMLTFNISERLKSIVGARFEKTDLMAESGAFQKPEEDRLGKINEADLLPSVNFIYSLNDNMNIRATYSKTLARPNMREIAPFTSFDPLEKFFYNGNTQLQRTLIDNADLRWEYFMRPGEVFAISAYYKNFDNPISLQYIKSSNPELQFTNVTRGEVYGLEFEFRKDLDMVAHFLRNFKLNTNVSLIGSSIDVDDVTGNEPDNRPYEGQSPFIVNVSLSYTHPDAGIDAILSLNSLGDRLNFIGREGTPDVYDRGRNQLDFNLIKKIGDVNLRLSAQNLLDAEYVLSSKFEGQEYIYSRFQRGVTVTFGVSYTIR